MSQGLLWNRRTSKATDRILDTDLQLPQPRVPDVTSIVREELIRGSRATGKPMPCVVRVGNGPGMEPET